MRGDKLQEIIELFPYSIRYSGEIEELLDYAKEQAERVQELEYIIYQDARQDVLEGLYEENKRYREALEFYAERDNYTTNIIDDDFNYHQAVFFDNGHIARKALGGEK